MLKSTEYNFLVMTSKEMDILTLPSVTYLVRIAPSWKIDKEREEGESYSGGSKAVKISLISR